MQTGRSKDAVVAATEMLAMPGVEAADLRQLAGLGQQLLEPAIAVEALSLAHARAPADLPLLFDLATMEHFFCRNAEAAGHLDDADSLCKSSEDFSTLGEKCGQLGDLEQSCAALKRACELAPDNHLAKLNLAVAHGFLGHIDEAEQIYSELIKIGFRSDLAFQNRSWLRRQSDGNNHIDELRKALSTYPGGADAAPLILYALGKELEDLGQIEEAFDCYARGAATRRRLASNYRVEIDLQRIDEIIRVFSEEFFDADQPGCASDEPIFIVGMARAGSTLLEQIIGRHSKVFPAGEMGNFLKLTNVHSMRVARDAGARQGLAPQWETQVPLAALGEDYIRSTRPRTGRTPHFIDKLPGNYMMCGLISRALPKAKIIHVHRDPMDAGYAMFKQSFHEGFNYTYDLHELGQVLIAYRKLMAHWDAVLPGRIIHVAYEDVVEDTENTVRDLIARLDLPWEDACLDHNAGEVMSRSASATQVRQPVYRSSVGKWRRLEKHLTPLREVLEDGGITVS